MKIAICVATLAISLVGVMFPLGIASGQAPRSGKNLGTIYNNDIDGTVWQMGQYQEQMTPAVYTQHVNRKLDGRPGVFAQNVGLPDGVIYPTNVGTNFSKYVDEVAELTWPNNKNLPSEGTVLNKLYEAGTDPLTLTIEACRKRGVLIVADYRMNAEDYYANSYRMSDFGRAHPEYRIPGTGCLDPAIPEVYQHRMQIFTEVAQNYDIDGIELDFRRWFHMISNPLENHIILTQMVRDVRKMLDETAHRKGRPPMLLGVRVGPMLKGDFVRGEFPGAMYGEPTNSSCEKLGLDVKTWVDEGLVDYICPTTFNPLGLPKTKEFANLVQNTQIGVYPTISQWPCGSQGGPAILGQPDNAETRRLYRDDVCKEALKCYADGADGISLFNWWPDWYPPVGQEQFPDATGTPRTWSTTFGTLDTPGTEGNNCLGFGWVQQEVMPALSKPETLRELLAAPKPATLALLAPEGVAPNAQPAANDVPSPSESICALRKAERVIAARGGGFFPVVIKLRDGSLGAAIRGGAEHLGLGGRLDFIRSTDGGRTWSKPVVAIDSQWDDRNPALVQMPDGTLVLAYAEAHCYKPDGTFDLDAGPFLCFLVTSTDDGQTWSQKRPISTPWPSASPFGRIVVCKDGTALMSLYLAPTGAVGILRSKDNGKTWGDFSLIRQGLGSDETQVIELSDERLMAFTRTSGQDGDNGLAVSESNDKGRTWRQTDKLLKPMEHPFDATLLHSGHLLLTHGSRVGPGQYGVGVILSKDAGRTWDVKHRVPLACDSLNLDTGYPSTVQLDDGTIVTMYYAVGTTTSPDTQAIVVRYTEEQLAEAMLP